MSFDPQTLRGASAGDGRGTGQIDYRLARRHTVSEFRRGRISKRDICDAHPELLRAARNVGRPAAEGCPICEDSELVLVSFVFGRRLPPSGRCVTTTNELTKLSRRADEACCYVVEVCPACAWNHLTRTFPLGGRSRR